MNNYATQAGRKYQRDLMKYLRDERGLDAEQLVLSGCEDEGDVLLRLPVNFGQNRRFVIEAKREKGFHLADWLTQAEVEAGNYAKHRTMLTPHFVVVHARRNHKIGKSYVTTSLDQWLAQILPSDNT